jgi:hypothetical protein
MHRIIIGDKLNVLNYIVPAEKFENPWTREQWCYDKVNKQFIKTFSLYVM